ncbi:MAG: hypothetical protein KGK33_08785 [Hyphomicrobiales bacterium]|nr:hypothetical protein [Hyphomicrobiales bacterium]
MVLRNWDSQRARREMSRLMAPGLIGFYTHFEATEIFATRGQEAPFNIFSILVAEERLPDASEKPRYLNPDRLKIKSLPDWNFGIKRYVKPIEELIPLFDTLCDAKEWHGAGQPLQVGDLASMPTQFVPPDTGQPIPWNRVLKNNFWNGSHVFEWADASKTALQPLFDDPPRLQELSEAVRAFVPIGLASLSDRLGNMVVQFPVTVLIAKFAQLKASGDFALTIAWHPKAAPRTLRASCRMNYDDAVPAFIAVNVEGTETLLPMHDGNGLHRGVLWDDANRVLLAATGDMSFISTIVLNLHVIDPEPRVFNVPDGKGGEMTVRFGLTPKPIKNVVGEPPSNLAGDWIQKRMYRDETDRLAAERRFVQYKPEPGQQSLERERALDDVRFLINRHGEQGVWLWDPYLTAEDVIDTLFYCRFFGADLRALTEGQIPPGEDRSVEARQSCLARLRAWMPFLFAPRVPEPSASEKFASKQRTTLQGIKSNLRGLQLEYRIRTGSAGWSFHDRFLIFPAADRAALAWSLGTSVNGLGKQHHILQRVDDGQRIRDAFVELWDKLDHTEQLIWKTP